MIFALPLVMIGYCNTLSVLICMCPRELNRYLKIGHKNLNERCENTCLLFLSLPTIVFTFSGIYNVLNTLNTLNTSNTFNTFNIIQCIKCYSSNLHPNPYEGRNCQRFHCYVNQPAYAENVSRDR